MLQMLVCIYIDLSLSVGVVVLSHQVALVTPSASARAILLLNLVSQLLLALLEHFIDLIDGDFLV